MSSEATEVCYLPLKEGINIEDGEAKAILTATLDTIAKQDGLKSLYHGKQIEHPSIFQMVITWHSIDNHEAFQQKPEYQPFLERIGNILSGPPDIFHANLLEGTNALDAAVTECIAAYFASDADQAKYAEHGWKKFGDAAAEIPGVQVQGLTGGWSVEPRDLDGEESKVFAGFIGWPSVGAHMEFRKTEDFTKVVPLLRGGTKKIAVHHVAFVRHA
ncbi:hypothetical protein BKA63DRAFT_499778 [Paraphoma chrysanthemicola]|nr:hypothetical protein BKA63DRAFT_499778 [Paraphoma chrysanthemicola]